MITHGYMHRAEIQRGVGEKGEKWRGESDAGTQYSVVVSSTRSLVSTVWWRFLGLPILCNAEDGFGLHSSSRTQRIYLESAHPEPVIQLLRYLVLSHPACWQSIFPCYFLSLRSTELESVDGQMELWRFGWSNNGTARPAEFKRQKVRASMAQIAGSAELSANTVSWRNSSNLG